jgi:hypothetical protein
MATATRTQNRYDHRLRELVRSTQDIRCAVQYGVPSSTARGWLKAPAAEVVTVDVLKMDTIRLQQEVLQLRARIQKLTALLRVLLVVLKLSGYSLNQSRLPDGKDKRLLLRAIERSRPALPLRSLLRVIRLSPPRYHAWNRREQCELDDSTSCPRISPHQLTPAEIATIARCPS